ncbi:mitochondrial ribonuclease P protein 1 homolog isoform X2 [Bradysia coprophila]|uniref:mitochondrial ribonuclease P protein 1 homolog isoform X2 n=1 Tax=Bradysia coprophila TaxID=38358 RepID=UPI00187DBD23|nr:mitochondrial ribonuclease P protein 1 homolog isoform X2 [Bradysia coprophila]
MLARQLIHLTRNFSSLSRHPSIVNQHTILCTLNSDSITRLYSIDLKDESSPVKTDEKEDRKMKLIKLEMESMREDGRDMPDFSFIKKQHWNEMLKLDSKSARRKYYNFLFVTQMKVEVEKAKKQQKALANAAFKEQQANDKPPSRSRFLLRIYDQTMNRWRNNRLFRAMQFSEKLVFDCSYDEYMNRQEAKSAAKQLIEVFSGNRLHRDPFDLHFCNVNFNSPTFERVQSLIPTLRDRAFPLHLHETSYLDVFPKDKLVYLTPHCKTDLTDYDPDAVYIIGAMVDTSNHEPLSMMKAKTLGIKMAKLPLERYLDWGQGDKTLTLDQMLKIMLQWRATQSWEKALQHVPRRKVMNKDVEVRKWTVNANKFKPNYRNENSFDNWLDSMGNDVSGLSTADKFKRKPGTFNQFSNERNTKPKFDVRRTDITIESKERPSFDSSQTDGISNKVKKPNRTGSKSRVDIKKLLDE